MVVSRSKKLERRNMQVKRFGFNPLREAKINRGNYATREELMDHEKRTVENNRDCDRNELWDYFRRSIERVESGLGFGIRKHLQTEIAKNRGRAPLKVLNLGCGSGKSLNDLKTIFGDKIVTTGITLEKLPEEKYEGIDKLLVGEFCKMRVPEKYDFIYSHFGPVLHTKDGAGSLSKLISVLKPGGAAISHISFYGMSPQIISTSLELFFCKRESLTMNSNAGLFCLQSQ